MPEPQTDTDRKASTAPVLVENRRHGITLATHSEKDPHSPADNPKWKTDQLALSPGLQLVDAEVWERFKPSIAERISTSEIVVHPSFAKLSKPVIVEALKNSGNVDTMRKLLETEKRPDIAKLLEQAISDTISGATSLRQRQALHSPR